MAWISGLAMLAWAADPVEAPPESPGIPQASVAKKRTKKDPFSPQALKKAMRLVVPAVERAAGRPFRTPPVVEIASNEAFGRILREETRLIYDAVHKDTPKELRERIIAEEQAGIGPGLLGKYAVFEDTLYLCEGNLRRAAIEGEVASLPDLVTVVLAHELVHALHDQYVDLAEMIRQLPDRDGLWAVSGTTEGLANWVEGRVAAELGLVKVHEKMNALQGWNDDGPQRAEAFRIWSHYGQGSRMMAYHFAEGGIDKVWEVAAQPPETTRGLFRPETWPARRSPPTLDYRMVLRGTEQFVTRGDWLTSISPLGEGPLWAEAYGAGEPGRVDAVLGRVNEAWSLEGVRPDRQAQIRILTFDSGEGAQEYLSLLRASDEGLAARLGSRLEREVNVQTRAFDQVPGDVAARRDSVVVGLSGTQLERYSAWVVRNNTMVVVLTENFRPGLRLGWAIEAVFDRLEAVRAGKTLAPAKSEPRR